MTGMLALMNAAILLSFGSAIVSLAAVSATFYGIRYTNKINMQLQNDRLHFDQRRQNQEMLRSKGEELFGLINSFEKSFRENLSILTKSLIIHNAFLPDTPMNLVESNKLRQNIELLTRTYFPSAIPQLERLSAYEAQLSEYVATLSSPSSAGANLIAGRLMLLTAEVDENAKKLQSELITLLQKLHEDVIEIHKAV